MTATMEGLLAKLEEELAARYPEVLRTFQPGADDQQIGAIARLAPLGDRLPQDFSALYRWRNGGGDQELWGDETLLGLDAIEECYRTLRKLRPDDFQSNWLPFVSSTSGNYLCLDLEGAFGGVPGQVLFFDHEGSHSIRHRSIQRFVETLAAVVEAGVLTTEQDDDWQKADEIYERLNPPDRHPLDSLAAELANAARQPQRVLQLVEPLISVDAGSGRVDWTADEPEWAPEWLGVAEQRRLRVLRLRYQALLDTQRFDEALDTIDCMERVDPYQRPRTRIELARLLASLERFDEAASLLRELLSAELKPWEKLDSDDRNGAMILLEGLGQKSDSVASSAADALREEAEKFRGPAHRHAAQWLRYAEAEQRTEQKQAALARARELYEEWYASTSPSRPTDFFNMARNYARLGDRGTVLDCLKRAMELDPKTIPTLIKSEPLLAPYLSELTGA